MAGSLFRIDTDTLPLKVVLSVTALSFPQELLVRLTDERDPFFLYTLALGEEDFQR